MYGYWIRQNATVATFIFAYYRASLYQTQKGKSQRARVQGQNDKTKELLVPLEEYL